MAFEEIANINGVSIQVDFTATGSRTIQVVNPSGIWISLRVYDETGLDRFFREGDASASFNFPPGLRSQIVKLSTGPEGVDMELPAGWGINTGGRRS